MFRQPNFITNKIFAFLNASINLNKKIAATETTLIYCVSIIVWLFLFITDSSSNFTAFSIHAASWHVIRLGPNNFILLQSG